MVRAHQGPQNKWLVHLTPFFYFGIFINKYQKDMECKYCTKICKNDNSLRNHERLCKLNPNRQIVKSNLIEYNKKVRSGKIKPSNQFTKAKENGEVWEVSDETKSKISNAFKGKKLSDVHKKKIQIAMKRAVIENPESYSSNNVSGRTPIITYNGFKLKGTWELETAKWLDSRNIKWTNILSGFEYEWNGGTHIYYPDFYLIDYDRYIEVKGYERDRDKSKWKVVKDLIVLKKNEITKIKKGIFVLELS